MIGALIVFGFVCALVIIDTNMGTAPLIVSIVIHLVLIGVLICSLCNIDKFQTKKSNPLVQQRIKELRLKRQLSPDTVANMLGMKPKQYLKYETGKSEITVDLLMELANFYNISIDTITDTNVKPMKTVVHAASTKQTAASPAPIAIPAGSEGAEQ